jgi:hypothetical protein
MTLAEVFLGLGQERLEACLRQISLGKLKTFQLFEPFKVRARLNKLNQESLRKAAPKFLARLAEQDEEFATELAQSILVSHLNMIIAVLNLLGVPHNEGFFEKDAELSKHLSGDWQQRAYAEFHSTYPEAILVFYLNHLAHEVDENAALFAPAVAAA